MSHIHLNDWTFPAANLIHLSEWDRHVVGALTFVDHWSRISGCIGDAVVQRHKFGRVIHHCWIRGWVWLDLGGADTAWRITPAGVALLYALGVRDEDGED